MNSLDCIETNQRSYRPKLLKVLGHRIRSLRREQGLSQEALGEKAGLHRTYISSLENGSRNVSILTLASVAASLDVKIRDLCQGIDS